MNKLKIKCVSWTQIKSHFWWNQYQRHNITPRKDPDGAFPFMLLLLSPAQEIKCEKMQLNNSLFVFIQALPCYSSQLYLYDIVCRSLLPSPPPAAAAAGLLTGQQPEQRNFHLHKSPKADPSFSL